MRTETKGVESFPPRRRVGEIRAVGQDFSPKFLEFKNVRRGKSDWGACGVRIGQKGGGNRRDDPCRLKDGCGLEKNCPGGVSLVTATEFDGSYQPPRADCSVTQHP